MSRVIVKGLPTNCTEASLRKFFAKYGSLSDCTLKYTKEGKFRKFAFVGFDNEEAGSKAINEANNSFMQSSRILVEECRPFGADDKPRAWSKYAKDSSAYKRSHPDEDDLSQKPKRPRLFETDSSADFSIFKKFEAPAQEAANTKAAEKPPELEAELLKGIEGDTKLSLLLYGLPPSVKQKNIKDWLAPVRVKAMKIVRNEESAAAFVSFNRAPDVRRALQKGDGFLGGFKVIIKRVKDSDAEADQANDSSQGQQKNQDDANEAQKEEEHIRDTILDTGRLFLRNLSYSTNEEDLRAVLSKFGELSDLQVIIDKRTSQCKGFAIAEYMFPENAVAAYSELDGSVFKGRMLHIIAGEEKRAKPETDASSSDKIGSSYKAEKDKKLKANAGKATHSWNTLFLGANTVADIAADRGEVEKRDFLLDESQQHSAGVRLAIAESNVVRETRQFLAENGVRLDAFSRPAAKRSNKVILVKNLPPRIDPAELERMFARHGDCKKVILPKCGVTALVIMGNQVDAKKAFEAVAFTKFRAKPLFLEWAPGDVFGEETFAESSKNDDDQASTIEESTSADPKKRGDDLSAEEKKALRKSKKLKKLEAEAKQKEEEEERRRNEQANDSDGEQFIVRESKKKVTVGPQVSHENEDSTHPGDSDEESPPETVVFVKNLSFETTDADLEDFFKKRGIHIKSANIARKLNPAKPTQRQSMGFGFARFASESSALSAIKDLQGCMLQGHSVELKIAHRDAEEPTVARKTPGITTQGKCTKILVRNLPFQAGTQEVEELFKTFGEIRSVRLPKKPGTKHEHRGFGFVDFTSVGEAKRAMEALVHSTHLYGRRLVLEWAKADDSVDEMRAKTMTRYTGDDYGKKQLKVRMRELQAGIAESKDDDDDGELEDVGINDDAAES